MIEAWLATDNIVVIPVVFPLLSAALCALIRCPIVSWTIAAISTWSVFCVSLMLVSSAFIDRNVIDFAFGDHKPPIGIGYHVDPLNVFVVMVLAFIAAIMIPYAKESIGKELVKEKQHIFYSIYLLCFAGMIGILLTDDIFNMYVFIEISSLATYALIAMGRDRRALIASFEYLILGTIGATFFLIGVGFLYMMTGTLNITDMAIRLPDIQDTRPIQAAFAFITLGLAMKIAIFPLHIWLTNAYAYAPSFVSALIAATSTKVMVYVFIRLMFNLFGFHYAFDIMPLSNIIIALAVLGILIGSLTAIYQHNVKRLLAFSSLAQLGYMMIGIGLATDVALTGSIVHIANHALAKGTLFLAVGAVYYRTGGFYLHHFYGVGRLMPWTMAAFVLAGLSLIGIPGTAGFLSKWYLMQAFIEDKHWLLLMVLLISSLLAVIYIWKVVEVAYFKTPDKKNAALSEAPILLLVPTWILALANLYAGIKTEYTLTLAQDIATILLGGSL